MAGAPQKKKKKVKLNPKQERFVHLYLGIEEKGKYFGNATVSYIIAYQYDVPRKQGGGYDHTSDEYNSASVRGSELLRNRKVAEYKKQLTLNVDKDEWLDRLGELAKQNNNLNVARASALDVLKVTGAYKETERVDIPQLEEVGQAIKEILGSKQ